MNKKLLVSILLAIVSVLLISSPVLAIANPNSITFGSAELRYKVFENVHETGDMLFIAECYVKYNPTAEPDESASEAFTFQVLNVAGDAILLQRPIPDYQDIVVSIYQTKVQVDAGFSALAYKLRIAGNVALFGALTEDLNMETVTLNAASDFIDQSTADGIESPLYDFCIAVVRNIEAEMSADHTIEIGGVTYLDTSGAQLFLAGVPSLNVFLPEIFQSTASPMTATDPEHTGALQTATTPTTMLGDNIGGSVTNMATWLGVSELAAGIVITSFLGLIFLPAIYFKTRNGTLSMVAASFWVVICGYLGLFPLAIAFIIAGVILILTAFLFWGKVSI